MEAPLRQRAFVPEPERKTIPRQTKSHFERNSLGRRYLEEVGARKGAAPGSRRQELRRFETLRVIRDQRARERQAKLERWKKQREHRGKYTRAMRSVAKQVG